MSLQNQHSSTHSHFDYLLIGHVTQDLTPDGPLLGGTVSYSARMAAALGLKVGIITSAPPTLDLSPLATFPILRIPSKNATTFENIQTPQGRIQYLYHRAEIIKSEHIPSEWRKADIVHLGPVANEIDPNLVDIFPNAFIGITAQGFLRKTDDFKKVQFSSWSEAPYMLAHCNAAIISLEDVKNQDERIQELTKYVKILVVTEGENGARVYWNGDVRHFSALKMDVVDLTGAGDIFAAVYFARLHATNDAWLACAQAVRLASLSVTRSGVEGIPTESEIQSALSEIMSGRQ